LRGGQGVAANQILYNLEHRGIEWELLPWCRKHGMPLMAYSPLGSDGARLLANRALRTVATRRAATPARVALAWLLRHPDVVVIAKAASEEHVRDNHAALELRLSAADLAELDRAFPPPRRSAPLDMI
jgi:diketogulonate reductase-like aldo/keto reductase